MQACPAYWRAISSNLGGIFIQTFPDIPTDGGAPSSLPTITTSM